MKDIHFINFSFVSNDGVSGLYCSNGKSEYQKSSAKKPARYDREMLFRDDGLIVVSKTCLDEQDIFSIQTNRFKAVDRPQGNMPGFCLIHQCLSGYAHGRPPISSYIPDILRKNVSSLDDVVVDGEPMLLLKGMKNGLSVAAWLSPSRNHALQRFRYEVDEKASSGGEMVFLDYCPQEFVAVGQHWMPRRYSYDYAVLTVNYEYDKSNNLVPGKITKGESKFTSSLSDFQINKKVPDHEFNISMHIPNGTPVTVMDAPQIDYIWLDGNIEPKTSELMLRIARGDHKFMPGVREPRFWMMALGILFIVFGISLKARSLVRQWREK